MIKFILELQLFSSGAKADYIATIPESNCTLTEFATSVKDKVNLMSGLSSGVCTPNNGNNTISLTLGALYKIQIFTDDELKSALTPIWAGTAYNSNSLNSVNELILNDTTSADAVTVVFKVILQPVRKIYMRSPNLTSFNNMGPNGESSIIKKMLPQVLVI